MPLHASFASDPACIAHVAGLPDEADVLYHKLASDGVYVSGCYIAVVRSTREVTPYPGPYVGPYLDPYRGSLQSPSPWCDPTRGTHELTST